MPDQLSEWIDELTTRPGHEKVRTLVQALLVQRLGASSKDVTFEQQLPVVRGRLDALIGYTVLEFKSNIDREMAEAERQIGDYISEKERKTGHRHVGVVTDGRDFHAYALVAGTLKKTSHHKTDKLAPTATERWLDQVLCLRPDLEPDTALVRAELGRESIAWFIARTALQEMWDRLADEPETRLKRSLWSEHLAKVYGSTVDSDQLFFQHTYLSVLAKTIAVHVLGLPVPDAAKLLDGSLFVQSGILGVAESDFFDWPMKDVAGPKLVHDIAAQTGRFKLQQVKADVLKGLYESLIDPEQRHELGEYYTPDWLAEKICRHVIDDPLNQRVLDPSCGSGTFVFHAVRLFV